MGGLGWNRFNPALFGLVAVTLLAPLYVGINPSFALVRPFFGNLDVLTQATPLAMMKQGAWINCASFGCSSPHRAAPWAKPPLWP